MTDYPTTQGNEIVYHHMPTTKHIQEQDLDDEPVVQMEADGKPGPVGAACGAIGSACCMCWRPFRALLKSIPEMYYAIAYFLLGFIFPPIWLLNAWWYQSDNIVAKVLSFLSMIIWSVLSLGSVIAILIYIGVFVPLFNLTPLADPVYPDDCYVGNGTVPTTDAVVRGMYYY